MSRQFLRRTTFPHHWSSILLLLRIERPRDKKTTFWPFLFQFKNSVLKALTTKYCYSKYLRKSHEILITISSPEILEEMFCDKSKKNIFVLNFQLFNMFFYIKSWMQLMRVAFQVFNVLKYICKSTFCKGHSFRKHIIVLNFVPFIALDYFLYCFSCLSWQSNDKN